MNNKLILSLCGATLLAPSSMDASSRENPNIIFILVDDLGYGEPTCYNEDAVVPTPNIDKIAQDGIRMTQAYAAPISSPSRSMYFTGKFAARNGVYHNFDGTCPGVSHYNKSFTPMLKEAGYATSWFGKWHQGWAIFNHPMNNGFDTGYGFMGGMHDYFDARIGSHYIGGPSSSTGFIYDEYSDVDTIKYLTEELTDRAISFIDKNKDNPFYIYMAYNAPHTPYQAPQDVVAKYEQKGYDKQMATRYAMVDVLDAQIGRLLDRVKQNGLEENTMVVFMSDNGASYNQMNGGLRGTKTTVWEGGIRVPLIAKLPGVIPAGTTSKSMCSIVDMPATLLGMINGDDNYTYNDSRNLMPYFKGEKSGNVHQSIVVCLNRDGDVVAPTTLDEMEILSARVGDWKLVKELPQKGEESTIQIFNLADDPSESKDLSDSMPQKRKELIEFVNDYLYECPNSIGTKYTRDTRGPNRKGPFVENSMESLLR